MALTVSTLRVAFQGEFADLRARLGQIGSGLKDLESEVKRTGAGFKGLDDRARKTGDELDGVRNKAKRAGSGFSGLAKRVKGAVSPFASVGKAVLKVTGLITALATAVGTIGFAALIKGSVQTAAEFEQIAISLEVLTGTAEGARDVLADVAKLVVATPFGLQELSTAARSISVIFGENTEAVREFTQISADIAAAFSVPVERIGENLSRAFSAGLGSADLLRDAGITPLILEIAGASSVAEVSSLDLAEALRKLAGEGGRAAGAAAAQAASLSGALSNTEIAFKETQRAFGEAFAPALIDLLVNTVQPAFQTLQKTIRDNSTSILDFAQKAIPGALSGFSSLVDSFGAVLRVGGTLAAFFLRFGNFVRGVQIVVQSLALGFFELRDAVVDIVERLSDPFAEIEERSTGSLKRAVLSIDEDLADARARLARAQQIPEDTSAGINVALGITPRQIATRSAQGEIDDLLEKRKEAAAELQRRGETDLIGGQSAEVAALEAQLTELSKEFTKSGEDSDKFAATISGAADALDAAIAKAREAIAGSGTAGPVASAVGAGGNLADDLNRPTTTQIKNLEKLQETIAKVRAAQEDSTEERIREIDREIAAVAKLQLALTPEAQNARAARIQQLGRERFDLSETLKDAEKAIPRLRDQFDQNLGRLRAFDPEQAQEFADALRDKLNAAVGDRVAQRQVFQEQLQELDQAIKDAGVGASLGDDVGRALGETFATLDVSSLAKNVGAALQQSATDSLSKAFGEAQADLGGVLNTLLGKAGGGLGGLFGGEDSFLGKLFKGNGDLFGGLATAAAGAALSSSTSVTSSASSAIQSAVDSTRQVRGVSVGPTSIPIAKVRESLQAAFIETNRILSLIEQNTRSSGSSTGSIQTGGSSLATSLLANEGASIS